MLDLVGDEMFLDSVGGLKRSVSPLALFAGGVIGVWFDPSDHATSFEDVNGTIPATQPGQPIGLWLDKSKGLVLGPEKVANGGPFAVITGWQGARAAETLSVVGAALRATATSGSPFGASYEISGLVVGAFYRFVGTLDKTYTGVGYLRAHSALNLNSPVSVDTPIPGTYGITFQATNAIMYVGAIGVASASGQYVAISSASVRELPGYHATQPVAASRPTLARHPKGGRRNLLTPSENFADALWAKVNSAMVAAGLGPDGIPAFRFVPSSAAAGHYVTQNLSATQIGVVGRVRVKLEGPVNKVTLYPGASGTFANFDLSAMTATKEANVVSATMVQMADGWVDLVAVWPVGVAATAFRLYASSGVSGAAAEGNGVDGILVSAPQLELGTVATPYQKVTSQYDVTEAGVPDCWGLFFDGADDFMVTPAIDLTGTDKVGVFAGVRKLSDAIGCIVELSASSGANAGAFNLFGDSSDGYRYSLSGSGGTASQYKSSGKAAPRSDVISAQFDISGATIADEIKPRENGLTPTLTVNAAGPCATANFGNYQLFLGRRGGTTLPAHMILNQLIVAGKGISAAEIGNNEPYINNKMGAY